MYISFCFLPWRQTHSDKMQSLKESLVKFRNSGLIYPIYCRCKEWKSLSAPSPFFLSLYQCEWGKSLTLTEQIKIKPAMDKVNYVPHCLGMGNLICSWQWFDGLNHPFSDPAFAVIFIVNQSLQCRTLSTISVTMMNSCISVSVALGFFLPSFTAWRVLGGAGCGTQCPHPQLQPWAEQLTGRVRGTVPNTTVLTPGDMFPSLFAVILARMLNLIL